jgi:hypothetical protein
MPGLRPTKAFTGVTLELATIRPGQRFGRIYHERYPDPLGFGKTKSRFSDPRRRPEDERFGVLYLGFTLKGCFVEAILRDRRNGAVGDYPIGEAELFQRRYAEIVVTSSLSLVDLLMSNRLLPPPWPAITAHSCAGASLMFFRPPSRRLAAHTNWKPSRKRRFFVGLPEAQMSLPERVESGWRLQYQKTRMNFYILLADLVAVVHAAYAAFCRDRFRAGYRRPRDATEVVSGVLVSRRPSCGDRFRLRRSSYGSRLSFDNTREPIARLRR